MPSQFEIIRPANTTAYATGDVINSDAVTASLNLRYNLPSSAGVLSAMLTSSNPAGTPVIHLHLFSSNFTIALDNAPFDPADAVLKESYIGTIVFDTWYAFVSNKAANGKPLAPLVLPSTPIYGVLVAGGAYTPISGEVLTGSIQFA
jgi:hypothetical protein